jgi:CheY-like chemotaxis protein
MPSQRSLRAQVLALVCLPTCLGIALLCEFAIQRHEGSTHAILESQGRLLAALHAAKNADVAFEGDRAALAQVAREMLSPEIAYARFSLPEAGVHADAARPGMAPIPLPPAGAPGWGGGSRLIQRGEISVMEVGVPIRAFRALPSLSAMRPGEALPATLGELRIGIDLSRVQAAHAQFTAALRGAEVALALALLAGLWLGVRHALRPLTQLSEAALRLSAGELEGDLPAGSSQEAAGIRAALLTTRRRLDEYRTQLASLRARLEARDDDLRAPMPAPPRPAPAPARANERNAGPIRVLLVEDSLPNRNIAREMLEGLGCSVHGVEDGVSALATLELRRYDLVFMDVQMPKLDGLATTIVIRQREAARGRARLPVVALTAHVRPEDRAQCIEAGMDDFISKPYTRAELAAAVARWCRATPELQPAREPDVAAEPALETVACGSPDETVPAAPAAGAAGGVSGDLTDAFLQRTDRLRQELEVARRERNGPRIQALARELAGGDPQLGADSLTALAKEVATRADERDADLSALAGELIDETDRTLRTLAVRHFGTDG